jgi:protein-tyrosine-phosphatase
MIGLTSARDEASRVLAAWLRGPRPPPLTHGATAPLVLFLCRSNTALSIMAEAMLRHLAHERVRAASAGDSPCARVDPYAIECLRERGIATTGLRSKGCDAFLGAYRPPVRFLITLGEVGRSKANWDRGTLRPTKVHWGMPDPTAVVGGEIDVRAAFEAAFASLDVHIRKFLALPLELLKGRALRLELERIGGTSMTSHENE